MFTYNRVSILFKNLFKISYIIFEVLQSYCIFQSENSQKQGVKSQKAAIFVNSIGFLHEEIPDLFEFLYPK